MFLTFFKKSIFAKNIPLISALLFANKVRLTENNDWVVFVVLLCISLLLFMMISLQRDSNIREFLVQGFADSSNGFASWVIVSAVFSLGLAALISQYLPIVPKVISDFHPLGLELNKFGFTFICVVLFYLLKAFLGFVFYQATGNQKKWAVFYFTNTKFYFILSLILLATLVSHYYLGLDKRLMFRVYAIFLGVAFVFKLSYYLLHKNRILPQQWYYKFLYICTLQIAPVLLLWKVLFF